MADGVRSSCGHANAFVRLGKDAASRTQRAGDDAGNKATEGSRLTLMEAQEASCLELWSRPASGASQSSPSTAAEVKAPSHPQDGAQLPAAMHSHPCRAVWRLASACCTGADVGVSIT